MIEAKVEYDKGLSNPSNLFFLSNNREELDKFEVYFNAWVRENHINLPDSNRKPRCMEKYCMKCHSPVHCECGGYKDPYHVHTPDGILYY